MTPIELLKIIHNLPTEQRRAYELDVLHYGQGFIKMSPDGSCKHVPLGGVYITLEDKK